MRFQVAARRIFYYADNVERVVEIPTFQIEAASRVEANLKLATILQITLTETIVSLEEI